LLKQHCSKKVFNCACQLMPCFSTDWRQFSLDALHRQVGGEYSLATVYKTSLVLVFLKLLERKPTTVYLGGRPYFSFSYRLINLNRGEV
jgi:hypothetical protein